MSAERQCVLSLLAAAVAGPLFALGLPAQVAPARHRAVAAAIVFQKRQRAAPPHPRHRHPGASLNEARKLPPDEREARLMQDPEFKKLPPERQKEMLRRLRQFSSMPPERQERVLARLRYIESLTPQQRENLQGVFDGWKALPPERRRPLRRAFSDLRQLPPPQREAAMQQPEFQQRFSSDDQALLRRTLDLNIPEDVFGAPNEPPASAR